MKNFKGQIAWTITWAVAFAIILFLMIIFLVVTAALSGKELFKGSEISFEEGVENLDAQRDLMKILNYPVDVEGVKNVKELIRLEFSDKEKYKSVLESEMKQVLDESEYEYIDSQTKNLRIRGYRVFAESLFDVESENFGSCIGAPKNPCRNLAEIYVPVSNSKMILIAIQGGQKAKEK